ncbi:MAG: type II toxin-antitoxin system PemK/MazF family toxin [Lachnospiraceae bacterium]|jgi:mRNA interferase MazF|nr:type II toxin-antitoxin system PemK/MazF family toxin [Lachnospiraceae bacterium]
MAFRQGDIVEVNFEPTLGHEPKKLRPALVVSSNDFNDMTSMTIVCPITSKDDGFFLHEPIPLGHDVSGFVVMEQIRAIDLAARKAAVIDHLDNNEMISIITCIKTFM